MSRYPFLDRHLPGMAPALAWWLDGLARPGKVMRPPPGRVRRLRLSDTGDLSDEAALRRGDMALAVPSRDWLTLQRNLPPLGAEEMRQILRIEVADRTPFAADDVWIGWTPGAVHIVRRAVVARALDAAQQAGGRLRWLIPQDDTTGAVIDLAAPADEPLRPARLITLAAVVTVAVLGGLILAEMRSLAAEIDDQRAALSGSAAVATEAETLRRQVEALTVASTARLPAALLPERPPLHVLLEELTVAVPDNTFLTGLRIDDRTLRISGITAAPEALVRTLEGAPPFASATFDGPITREAEGNRFDIVLSIAGAGE